MDKASAVVAIHAYAQAMLDEKLPRGEAQPPQPYAGGSADGGGLSGMDDATATGVVSGAIGGAKSSYLCAILC